MKTDYMNAESKLKIWYTAEALHEANFDAKFGINGQQNHSNFGNLPRLFVSAVARQPDGKVLVAGSNDAGSDNANNSYNFLAWFNRDGTADTTFGTNGLVTTSRPEHRISEILIQLSLPRRRSTCRSFRKPIEG